MISLVQRFYDPNAGVITVDGVGIRDLNLKWWRRQMGMVSQEPLLFNDTVRANIAYGKEDGEATEAELVAATNLSNAHTFISAMDKVGIQKPIRVLYCSFVSRFMLHQLR